MSNGETNLYVVKHSSGSFWNGIGWVEKEANASHWIEYRAAKEVSDGLNALGHDVNSRPIISMKVAAD